MEEFSSSTQGGQIRNEDFQKLSHAVSSGMKQISNNVSSMKKMVNQIGTAKDTLDFKAQLYTIENHTQQLVKDTYGKLKNLNALPSSQSIDAREWKVQKDRLHDEFLSTMNNFQSLQKNVVQKVKDEINKGLKRVNNPDQAHQGSHSGHKEDQQDVRVKENETEYDRKTRELGAVINLDRGYDAVEKDILEIERIYRELHASVQRGPQQEPRGFRNKYLKKKFILPLIGSVILLVVIISVIVSVTI